MKEKLFARYTLGQSCYRRALSFNGISNGYPRNTIFTYIDFSLPNEIYPIIHVLLEQKTLEKLTEQFRGYYCNYLLGQEITKYEMIRFSKSCE